MEGGEFALAGAGFVRYSNDLHVLDPTSMTWTKLDSASGVPPDPRTAAGFAASEGKVYVYGGQAGSNGEWIEAQ
eukprot:3674920-Rhodomonas_salina.3